MSESVNEDYVKFRQEIAKSSKTLFKIEGGIEISFKKHHKSIYAIALILTKLNKAEKKENEIAFLTEILSDLLTSTKLLFLGFETPALIILRRITENFYNHIYYCDHSIEYAHLNNGKNEYTPIEKLKLYFDSHPKFFDNDDPYLKEFNSSVFKEYQQLCKVVHSKGKDSMNLAKCLKDVTIDFDINEILKLLINIEISLVYLLYKFHKELKFTATEKAILTAIIPANKRGHFNE